MYGASHSVFVAKPSNDQLPFRLWKARDRWYSHDGSRGLRKRKASERSSVIVSQWNGDGASMHWLLRSVRSRVPACPWYAVPRTSRVSPISRWHAPLIVSLITATSTRGLWLDSTNDRPVGIEPWRVDTTLVRAACYTFNQTILTLSLKARTDRLSSTTEIHSKFLRRFSCQFLRFVFATSLFSWLSNRCRKIVSVCYTSASTLSQRSSANSTRV